MDGTEVVILHPLRIISFLRTLADVSRLPAGLGQVSECPNGPVWYALPFEGECGRLGVLRAPAKEFTKTSTPRIPTECWEHYVAICTHIRTAMGTFQERQSEA